VTRRTVRLSAENQVVNELARFYPELFARGDFSARPRATRQLYRCAGATIYSAWSVRILPPLRRVRSALVGNMAGVGRVVKRAQPGRIERGGRRELSAVGRRQENAGQENSK